jgi:hypothetical protein
MAQAVHRGARGGLGREKKWTETGETRQDPKQCTTIQFMAPSSNLANGGRSSEFMKICCSIEYEDHVHE